MIGSIATLAIATLANVGCTETRSPTFPEHSMRLLPSSLGTLFVRTNFAFPDSWASVSADVLKPVGPMGFTADVMLVDDTAFDGLDVPSLIGRLPRDSKDVVLFIADAATFGDDERTILVVDLADNKGATFRTRPQYVQAIENNLSMGNMDFDEFASSVDERNVFRGFRRPR